MQIGLKIICFRPGDEILHRFILHTFPTEVKWEACISVGFDIEFVFISLCQISAVGRDRLQTMGG